MRRTICALALLGSISAQAGVIYNWQTVGGSDRELVGQLEFTPTAWHAGRVDYAYEYPPCGSLCPPEDYVTPTSPVISFTFRAIGANDSGGIILRYHDGLVGQEDGNASQYFVDLGPTLRGESIVGSGGGNLLDMASVGDLWTINHYFHMKGDFDPCSTEPFPEPEPQLCAGVTGRWVLEQSTVPIPLPGSLALLALGLAGVVYGRRERA